MLLKGRKTFALSLSNPVWFNSATGNVGGLVCYWHASKAMDLWVGPSLKPRTCIILYRSKPEADKPRVKARSRGGRWSWVFTVLDNLLLQLFN